MAGTANDYVGTLTKTRSGRTCDKWPIEPQVNKTKELVTPRLTRSTRTPRSPRVKSPKFGIERFGQGQRSVTKSTTPMAEEAASTNEPVVTVISPIARESYNDSLYPEGSAKNASNYCRNPSRNIAGTWCYTTDPLVPRDLCNVRDCEKPGECRAG